MDIARMAFVTGLTFWLGNAFVLACVLSYAPKWQARSINCRVGHRLIGLSA